MKTADPELEGLRKRARSIPLEAAERQAWAEQFNNLPAMRRFETSVDLGDAAIVRVVLESILGRHWG